MVAFDDNVSSITGATEISSLTSMQPHRGKRWNDAIRAVMQEQEEKRRKRHETPPDPLGDRLTSLINKTPEFRYSEKEEAPELIRIQNLREHFTLYNILRLPVILVKALRELFSFLTKNSRSLPATLKFFCTVLLLSISLLVCVCHRVIVWVVCTVYKYGQCLVVVLVDVEQAKSLCPTKLLTFVEKCIAFVKGVDNVILFGNRHKGRDWNADGHVWRADSEAQCRREMLYKCPPPSAKGGRRRALDPTRLDPRWSKSTQKHVLGINYCFLQLRDDYVRRQQKYERMVKEQAEERTKRQEAYKRAQSERFTQASLSTRGLVSPERPSSDIPPETPSSTTSSDVKVRIVGELQEESIELVEPNQQRSLSDTDLSQRGSEDEGSISCFSLGSHPDDYSLANRKRFLSSENSGLSNDDSETDLNWLDVGTKIGMRLLHSEHVQRAIASQDTAEKIIDISKKMDLHSREALEKKNESLLNTSATLLMGIQEAETPSTIHQLSTIAPPSKPMHSLWTSPASAFAAQRSESSMSISDLESDTSEFPSPPPPKGRKMFTADGDGMLPPRSPHARRIRKHHHHSRKEESSPAPPPRTRRHSLPIDISAASTLHVDKNHAKLECAAEARLSPPEDEDQSNGSHSLQRAHRAALAPQSETTASTPSTTSHLNGEGKRHHHKESLSESRRSSPVGRSSPADRRLSISPQHHRSSTRRPNLQPGVKVVVPIIPVQPGMKRKSKKSQYSSAFQMATVVRSRRIHLRSSGRRQRTGMAYTNCLSVTVKLDKSFLRGGEFAELTFRVRDEWGSRYMPRHSKFPIGACVATSYGIGVLVGWRVEDDIHVVRSLWQHRGVGTAHAYLNRDAIHGVMEAAVGFDVQTNLGHGTVLAYVNGGKDFRSGSYFVHVKEDGRHKGQALEFTRSNIVSCHGAKFIPVIEFIREAVKYQLLIDSYNAALDEHGITGVVDGKRRLSADERLWRTWSKCLTILWESFLKAVEEDKAFDQGMNTIFTALIQFLEGLDGSDSNKQDDQQSMTTGVDTLSDVLEAEVEIDDGQDGDISTADSSHYSQKPKPGFWFLDEMFGGVFHSKEDDTETQPTEAETVSDSGQTTLATEESDMSYKHTFAIIRSLMRTVAIARASCVDEPNLRLALSLVYEFLIFVNTVVKVQQKNVTQQSIMIWKRTLEEVDATLGPIKDRLHKIGKGIAERMEKTGKKAKVRTLRFVDIMLADERLMAALDSCEWEICVERVEEAMVRSKIIDESSRQHYHKTIMFIYDHSTPSLSSESAAARNGKKLAAIAKALKWMATPRQSGLSLLIRDDVLELVERIFVRVFHKDDVASRMLTIHASNFHSLRQLRMLKDFTIAGKLWIPLLDAANEELHWAVANMSENMRDLMVPVSKLFSLCVAQFHKLEGGDLTADWLNFLMDDAAVKLINEIDVKLVLAIEAACKDVKEVMVVLPYYASIDDDILNLMDDFNVDEFLKEASDAIVDADKLADFVREKTTIAIERFLDYMPKMSIPVKQRELGDGWVLSCHGEDGGDLTLSDVNIKRENLSCQVLGGETMFFPMFGKDDADCVSYASGFSSVEMQLPTSTDVLESSILDHIRELLLQAHRNGCWEAGVGGVEKPPTDRYVASALGGMPVTDVLNCAIDLWRNLEIDDDELLEIAIRDVSYQIQLHSAREKDALANGRTPRTGNKSANFPSTQAKNGNTLNPTPTQRFNPRIDPTVLSFEIKKLTLNLERFHFRIEKLERLTFFDPVFEGQGTLHVRNFSLRLRVECRKEKITKSGSEQTVPILQLQELDIGIEKVKFKVTDTGADWIVNQAVKGFSEKITEAVETNLKEQVKDQIRLALESLNSYFMVNPDLLLGLLGITMDDLEENIVWV